VLAYRDEDGDRVELIGDDDLAYAKLQEADGKVELML